MKKGITIITVLTIALIVSNVWWAYRLLDAGVTLNYTSVSMEDNKQALNQALSIIPVVTQKDASRDEVIAAARMHGDTTEPFEKDGYVWVGKIGLQFGQNGKLVKVVKGWTSP
jgi:hypothetical protein